MSLKTLTLSDGSSVPWEDFSPAGVESLWERLGEWLLPTPVVRARGLEDLRVPAARVYAKLEFLQRTGTFKPRGALSVMLGMSAAERDAGVTAFSAGNHAVATAFAARALGISARVVMTTAANPARVEACRHYGADVLLEEDIHAAVRTVERIRDTEGRRLVHPFEGRDVIRGTATLGFELCRQLDPVDAIVVPIGGGGLCAGIATVVKQLRPECEVIGVEPTGADTMHRSFAAGCPRAIEKVETIADSLGAPFALPLSFELCRRNVDRLVAVDDRALRQAMRILFDELKAAVEPACAASTAALLGPLAKSLAGKRVALVLCGSNTDWPTWERLAFDDAA